MNTIDKQIIKILLKDSGTTNSSLAKQIGLSESATLERVKKLEADEIILGRTLVVEPRSVGRELEFYMSFTLKNQRPQDIRNFEKAMKNADEVLSCAQLLGRFDFIAHVAVKDMAAMREFIDKKLISLGLIEQMESFTVLNMIKRNHPPYPLETENSAKQYKTKSNPHEKD